MTITKYVTDGGSLDKSKGPWKKGKKQSDVKSDRIFLTKKQEKEGYVNKKPNYVWDKRKPEIGGYDPELDDDGSSKTTKRKKSILHSPVEKARTIGAKDKVKRKTKSGTIISKTEVHKGSVGSKKGWAFSVYFGKEYPNVISALYKTKTEAHQKLDEYIKTDHLDTYGSAE